MIALDTNAVIDLEEGAPDVAEAVIQAIESAGRGRLAICSVVYAELLASAKADAAELLSALRSAQIAVDFDLSAEVWSGAGLAFGVHARRRGQAGASGPRRILADFIIGAHAYSIGSLVTSDAAFYRRAFPDLRVIDARAER